MYIVACVLGGIAAFNALIMLVAVARYYIVK